MKFTSKILSDCIVSDNEYFCCYEKGDIIERYTQNNKHAGYSVPRPHRISHDKQENCLWVVTRENFIFKYDLEMKCVMGEEWELRGRTPLYVAPNRRGEVLVLIEGLNQIEVYTKNMQYLRLFNTSPFLNAFHFVQDQNGNYYIMSELGITIVTESGRIKEGEYFDFGSRTQRLRMNKAGDYCEMYDIKTVPLVL